MAQKHLKELLKEDQEPFHLQGYIADRQCLLEKQPKRTQIQLKKPKPISKSPSFFCKNACFFSLQSSPDPRKSPLFDFTSPVHRSPNRVLLHVPAKTAALLLEAAMRIQKPENQQKNSGFRLFGSIMKRLTHRNWTQKLKSSDTVDERETEEQKKNRRGEIINEEKLTANISSSSSSSVSSSSCSCNGTQSSLDLESSSSRRSFDEEEEEDDGFEFANVVRENGGHSDYGLCISPLSPFRFALHTNPSPDCRRSPVFSSPAKSHAPRKIQDNVNNEQQYLVKFQEDEDEEDKEQNSPVSVLDTPFEDDDYDVHEDDSHGVDECSYFVQRAKQHRLNKLDKFDRLAELDPIELEKRMIEEEQNDEVVDEVEDYEEYSYETFTFEEQRQVDAFIDDIIKKSGFQDMTKHGIKRLVSDLVIEESTDNTIDSDEHLLKRVCQRLGSWEEVESNTIDMMVEIDLKKEVSDWKRPQEQVGETARDVEDAIFKVLVEELLEDLSYSG